MKKWQIAVLVIAVAVLAAGIGAYAASNYGTQSDPLVAMSYLEDVLQPKIESSVDAKISEAAKGISGGNASFAVVNLGAGTERDAIRGRGSGAQERSLRR